MKGSVMFLHGEHKLVAYGRFTDKQRVVVVLNNNYEDKEVKLNVTRLGVPNGTSMKQQILSAETGYFLDYIAYPVVNSKVTLQVPKLSAIVLMQEDFIS